MFTGVPSVQTRPDRDFPFEFTFLSRREFLFNFAHRNCFPQVRFSTAKQFPLNQGAFEFVLARKAAFSPYCANRRHSRQAANLDKAQIDVRLQILTG